MATLSEIKVGLTGVYLCCQGGVNAVDAAIMSVEGPATNTPLPTFRQTSARRSAVCFSARTKVAARGATSKWSSNERTDRGLQMASRNSMIPAATAHF